MSAITESARGEECQVRLPGICLGTRDTTVLAHGNGSAYGKGFWAKSPDYQGAYACWTCHDVYDRRLPIPKDIAMTREQVELYFAHAVFRTQRILQAKGLLDPQE